MRPKEGDLKKKIFWSHCKVVNQREPGHPVLFYQCLHNSRRNLFFQQSKSDWSLNSK